MPIARTNGLETKDWNNNEHFYRYTSGRWLYGEEEQLSRRYVKFNMKELARIASQAVGSSPCMDIVKLPEGNFNKTFLMTMDDGKQVVARVPNPNAGQAHYTTASEVATMDFARNILGLPVPRVHTWSSRISDNPVGSEYIIMEKVSGVELRRKWPEMKGTDKHRLILAIVQLERAFLSTSFDMIGSVYYIDDVPGIAAQHAGTQHGRQGSRFVVGPTTDRKFWDDGRGSIAMDRGPWCTAEDYVTAIARREITCIQELNRRPRPEGLFGGPGSYEPSTASKLSVLHDYLKVAKQILPRDASISSPHLWHGDLNHDNIFVDPEKPSEIVGLIDWQSVHIEPLFLEVNQPAFLDFDGPRSSGSGLPCLPENFNDLTEVEKNHAKSLLSKQSLFKLYEIESARKNKEVFRALRYQDTLGCQIISLIGHMLNDGEPIVKGQLMQLEREWSKVVGQDGPQCPLRFSVEEEAAQEQDEEKWGKGIVLVDQVLTSLGGAQRGWDGWVAHEDYDLMKEKLQTVRNQFLDYMSNDARDRARWSAVWPFGGS